MDEKSTTTKNSDKSKEELKAKRLKNLRPFVKGDKRINRKGYPKGQRNFATIYREALVKLARENKKKPDDIETEMIANATLLARKGDYRFYKDVLDRLHGTAIQKTESNVKLDIGSILDEIEKQ